MSAHPETTTSLSTVASFSTGELSLSTMLTEKVFPKAVGSRVSHRPPSEKLVSHCMHQLLTFNAPKFHSIVKFSPTDVFPSSVSLSAKVPGIHWWWVF